MANLSKNVVDVVCPEKAQLFRNVSLSARTVTRRICEISNDIKRQQVEKLNSLRYYSIAIDESTDVTDTAQLAVFIRGVNDNFEIFDSFVKLVPLKDTTTGADILAALLQCIEQMHLDLTNLVSVTTDGAPAMTGRNRGVVALLQKHMNDVGVRNIFIKIHCIIHKEALCAKVLHIKTVMDVVVKAVNIILSRGLNHLQFRELLSAAENCYGDLLYFCDVRWLSRGAMLERVYLLKAEIAEFLEIKGFVNFTQFRDPKWLTDLAFLVDLTSHLNKLNLQLQGRQVMIHKMWRYVQTFEVKLRLWENQLQNKNFAHFPTLKKHELDIIDCDIYLELINKLRTEFYVRFVDIRQIEKDIKLFSNPFDVNANEIPEKYQMEIIEIQCNDELKASFQSRDVGLIKFYKTSLCESLYPNIRDHAKKMAALYGSTYSCEQLFSKMKFSKNNLRSRLTDENLQHTLLIAASDLSADIPKLAKDKDHQVSH